MTQENNGFEKELNNLNNEPCNLNEEIMSPSCPVGCDCMAIHHEKVEHLKNHFPSEEEILEIADLFKLFADSTRAKILWALEGHELCVNDLSVLLNMTKSLTSHQLRKLREAKLVKFRKEGKLAYYSLDDEHVADLLKIAQEHITENVEEVEEVEDEEQINTAEREKNV